MNLLKAVRSGRRFKKPGGIYIERDPAGMFVSNVPGKGLCKTHFFVGDFEIDTWELEPLAKEKLPVETPVERVELALSLIRSAIHELAGMKVQL